MRIKIHTDSDSSRPDVTTSSLLFPITADAFHDGKLKIRCSASIYDIYWQSTEVSTEEERSKAPDGMNTKDVIGINYHQPPPNYQLGQKKLNGEIDIKGMKYYF
ncbi:hypothetical protein QAD02_008359 [Eretmocerus hayati]|uniref:Uncharacterized protein n=1 Tax=Eretmocerus hayati TaxID=131215 RepID=A0ACC2N6K7_9HYME|nr:hypothetical protein QAD02_008359 [Eretmocerus hayati]